MNFIYSFSRSSARSYALSSDEDIKEMVYVLARMSEKESDEATVN